MPDDTTEVVATYNSRLQPSINCMPQFQPLCCSGTKIYDPEVTYEGWGHWDDWACLYRELPWWLNRWKANI